MTARRCVSCDISWPHLEKYARCPGCNGKTGTWFDTKAMTVEEAESLGKHLIFDRFYGIREAKREKKGDPTPEARGALAATELTDLERSWLLENQTKKG